MSENSLQGVSREDAAKRLGMDGLGFMLEYYAWPQVFPSTAGPFGGCGGCTATSFTIEAWSSGRDAILFCHGKILRMTNKFEPMNTRV